MIDRRKRRFLFSALSVLFLFGILLSLLTGAVETSLKDILRSLSGDADGLSTIIFQVRLPRALLAFLVGAALSLSGAILQGYFQNPLADPFIVGVSSGASLGAIISAFLGLDLYLFGFSSQSLFAFLSGLAIVSLVYFLSQSKGVFKLEVLLLTGIAAGAFASALTSFLLFLRADSYEQAVFWLLGSLSLAGWQQAGTMILYLLISLVIAQTLAKDMNLLVQGDDIASSLGCPVALVRKSFLAIATLLAAAAVSVSGIIGFVGLIIPHLTRILIGPDHRFLFLHSTFMGGVFLLYSDLLARTVLFPSELPIGIITAAFGAPFFIFLLSRRK